MSIITLAGQLPTALLSQALSFSLWLAPGDSLVSVVVTADPGITIADPAPSIVGESVVFWLTGGTLGETYIITVTVTTAFGDVFPQQCRIAIGTPSVASFNAPTLDGYIAWLREQGFTDTALPADSMFLALTYENSLATVNRALISASPIIYTLAVYNLGADFLINWTPDQPGSTFFVDLRKGYGVLDFSPGVVSSSSDNGTSTSLMNPDFLKGLTMGNLQNLKTPYGRQYLAWAQSYGTVWGLS